MATARKKSSKKTAVAPGITFVRELDGISEYRLEKNGLRILLAPDPAQPVVGLMVTYLVGSRHEKIGYTGSAHLLEHLLFKGSKKFNKKNKNGIREVLNAKGAHVNASTYYDRTNYYEVMTQDLLGIALEMEADRMRNAFIIEKDRQSEMTVVRNEFERREDSPFLLLYALSYSLAFQAHPYHHPVIGWRDDIENISIEQLRGFYDEYYWPDNAVLTVAGGLEPEAVLKRIKSVFGTIPKKKKGGYPSLYTQEPPQEGQRRGIVKRTGPNMLNISFRMPAAGHPDLTPLGVAGRVLSTGKTSRLYKALIDTGLATGISGDWAELHDPGLFQLYITMAEGKTHQKVEEAVFAELKRLKKEIPPKAEIDKARSSLRMSQAKSRDGVYSFLSSLNEDIAAGDWTRFTTYLESLKNVTAKDVHRVANTYFNEDTSVVCWFMHTE